MDSLRNKNNTTSGCIVFVFLVSPKLKNLEKNKQSRIDEKDHNPLLTILIIQFFGVFSCLPPTPKLKKPAFTKTYGESLLIYLNKKSNPAYTRPALFRHMF